MAAVASAFSGFIVVCSLFFLGMVDLARAVCEVNLMFQGRNNYIWHQLVEQGSRNRLASGKQRMNRFLQAGRAGRELPLGDCDDV